MIKFLKEENFDSEISKGLILVDFYADWCGPCKMLGKVLESVDSIDILKVNVDEYPEIAKKYGVMSIPTIIIFNQGQLKQKSIGFLSKDELENFIQATKKEIQQ